MKSYMKFFGTSLEEINAYKSTCKNIILVIYFWILLYKSMQYVTFKKTKLTTDLIEQFFYMFMASFP